MDARGWVVGAVVAAGVLAGASGAQASESVAFQGDAAHSGAVSDPALDGTIAQRWSTDLGGAIGPSLVTGGRVFTVVQDPSLGARLAALDAATGRVLWFRTLGQSTGIAADAGGIFVVSSAGSMVRLDQASGVTTWTSPLRGQYSFSSAPSARNGVVYTGGAGSGGTLYALDEATGTIKWTQPVANGDDSSPAVDDTGVYVSYACPNVYKFALDGRPLWHNDPGCEGGGGATPTLSGGQLLVRDPSGDAVFDAATGAQSDGFSSDLAPAMASTWGVTSTDGVLEGVDRPSLRSRWTLRDRLTIAPPFIVDGRAFALAADGHLIGVDGATGRVVVDLPVGPAAVPGGTGAYRSDVGLAVGGGVLVAPASDGHLVGFWGPDAPPSDPGTPPATTTTTSATPTTPATTSTTPATPTTPTTTSTAAATPTTPASSTPSAPTTTPAAPPADPSPTAVAPVWTQLPAQATSPAAPLAATRVRLLSAARVAAVRRGVRVAVTGARPGARVRVRVLRGTAVLASTSGAVPEAGGTRRVTLSSAALRRLRGSAGLRLEVRVTAPGARPLTATARVRP